MSAQTALSLYFKAKDIEGHYETVKSLHDYAGKLKGKKAVKPKDIQFFKSDQIGAADKGLKHALSLYKAAAKSAPDWPANDTALFFKSMLKSADKSGHDSQATKNTRQNYLNKCQQYDKALKSFEAELVTRAGKIADHLKLMTAMKKYCQGLQKLFLQIARIPSLLTSAEQLHWVVLSEGAVTLTGRASSCETTLETLRKSTDKTLKECRDQIKTNQLWIKWMKSAAPTKAGALKKNLTASTPK